MQPVNLNPSGSLTRLPAFIWRQQRNRKFLWVSLVLTIAQFAIFKLLYPFPDCFQDSISYIHAAHYGLDINIWPIGYSKFLAAFHFFSHSSTALVAFQFFFLEVAALYFFFTLLCLFTPGPPTQTILFALFFANPLNLYLANTVASDSIFGALTLLWLSEMMWMIQQPRIHNLFTQAALLFLCATLRNTTWYYPIIAAIALYLSPQAWWRKLTGIALPFLFIVPFILHTRNVAYSITGTYQSSLLTGWQLGNNALYIYNHITIDSTDFPTPEAKEINRNAIQFFKKIDLDKYYRTVDPNAYIVMDPSPLRQYWRQHGSSFSGPYHSAVNWGRASAAILPFGKTIIIHHPWGYIRYFALANIENYLYPPLCDLKIFHNGTSRAFDEERLWFDYKSDKVSCISFDLQSYLGIYSSIFFVMNGLFLFQLVTSIRKRVFTRLPRTERYILFLLTAYLFVNFLFTINASINLLRYQYIPLFVLFTITLLFHEKQSIKN